jgi:hypothetical protein
MQPGENRENVLAKKLFFFPGAMHFRLFSGVIASLSPRPGCRTKIGQ